MKQYAYKYRLQKVNENAIETIKITSSTDVYDYTKKVYENLTQYQEHFTVLFLNRQNKIIGHEVVSSGGTSGTVVDKKIIAKLSLDVLANSIVLIHNHPSGTHKPSEADIKITKDINKALMLFDIPVLDHLILTENEYFSFANNGINFI